MFKNLLSKLINTVDTRKHKQIITESQADLDALIASMFTDTTDKQQQLQKVNDLVLGNIINKFNANTHSGRTELLDLDLPTIHKRHVPTEVTYNDKIKFTNIIVSDDGKTFSGKIIYDNKNDNHTYQPQLSTITNLINDINQIQQSGSFSNVSVNGAAQTFAPLYRDILSVIKDNKDKDKKFKYMISNSVYDISHISHDNENINGIINDITKVFQFPQSYSDTEKDNIKNGNKQENKETIINKESVQLDEIIGTGKEYKDMIRNAVSKYDFSLSDKAQYDSIAKLIKVPHLVVFVYDKNTTHNDDANKTNKSIMSILYSVVNVGESFQLKKENVIITTRNEISVDKKFLFNTIVTKINNTILPLSNLIPSIKAIVDSIEDVLPNIKKIDQLDKYSDNENENKHIKSNIVEYYQKIDEIGNILNMKFDDMEKSNIIESIFSIYHLNDESDDNEKTVVVTTFINKLKYSLMTLSDLAKYNISKHINNENGFGIFESLVAWNDNNKASYNSTYFNALENKYFELNLDASVKNMIAFKIDTSIKNILSFEIDGKNFEKIFKEYARKATLSEIATTFLYCIQKNFTEDFDKYLEYVYKYGVKAFDQTGEIEPKDSNKTENKFQRTSLTSDLSGSLADPLFDISREHH